MGYSDVVSLQGGFNAWKDQGLPFTVPHNFTAEQRERYSRHFLLNEVGEVGQAKLLDAKVLLLGAGGLGAPIAYYLAAAGVGTIGLVDFDRVELSNLQRQIVHTVDRIGMPKTESAAIALRALNPDVKVVEHQVHLDSENAAEIFSQYDVIVNGSDNFPTRYLANDMAVFLRKPLVDGGIFRFEGQVTTMIPFQLFRGRRTGGAPRLGRADSGNRGGKADPGDRGATDRSPAPRGCPGDGVQHLPFAARPGLPSLRRAPVDHRAHRLRGLLSQPKPRRPCPGRGLNSRAWASLPTGTIDP
jgi:molybdopterin/thiamine biosynthesis adenylyltransferase